MITIENIQDLEKYLFKRFSDEPTVNVHVVSGDCLGDTAAVEVIPKNPDEGPWVAFFSLTFDDDGHTDGIQGTAYKNWDPENSSPQWWKSEYGTYLGWLPACGPDRVFGTHGLNVFMGRVFGPLYHPDRTRTRNSLA